MCTLLVLLALLDLNRTVKNLPDNYKVFEIQMLYILMYNQVYVGIIDQLLFSNKRISVANLIWDHSVR